MEDITLQAYNDIMSIKVTGASIFFFSAEFYSPSQQGGQVYEVVNAMSQKYTTIKFYRIDAEADDFQNISKTYNIEMIPSFVAIHNGKLIGSKVEGGNPSNILELVKLLISAQRIRRQQKMI